MGMLDQLKGMVKDTKITEELCEHVKSYGLDARVIDPKDEDAVHHSTTLGLGSVPLGSIKINGRGLDVVEMYRMINNSGGRGSFVYIYQCVSKFNVGDREKYFDVQIEYVTKGLIKKELVDFHWVGGKFADALNADEDIRDRLISLNVPEVIIHPNKKDGYVAFSSGMGVYNMMSLRSRRGIQPLVIGKYDFPSSQSFELYEQLMNKIKSDPTG